LSVSKRGVNEITLSQRKASVHSPSLTHLKGHMECYPLNHAGRGTKDPASVLTKEGWFPRTSWFTSVFKVAAWRLYLLDYAHLVRLGAIQVLIRMLFETMLLRYRVVRC